MPLKICAMPDQNTSLWQIQSAPGHTEYRASFAGRDKSALKQALETAARHAISLLDRNIREDSLYLLFEWNPSAAELAIVVTDAEKKRDGDCRVVAVLPEVQTAPTPELDETIPFLLSDFLASYSPFFSYSLVAIFHQSTRAHTRLL